MEEEKRNIPEVRFREFAGVNADAWELRKLGEVVEMFNGDRGVNYPKNSDLISQGVPFINAGDLQNGQVNLESCKKISKEKFNQLSGAKIRRGDILYCLRGTIGKNAMVEFDGGTVASSLVDIRPKNIDGMYLFIILNSNIEYRQRLLNDEGAAQPNLSVKNLSKFYIPVPRTKEQHKISALFKSCNELITLHQRELDNLKALKKTLLSKMFPKNYEKYPEIRFSGFTDAWELRKITELGKIYIGLVTTMTEHYVNKGTLLIRNSDIKEGKFEFGENPIFLDESFSKKNKSRMHQIGDVITVHTGDIGTSAVITEREANSIGFATIVTRPKKEVISSQYLCTFLNTEQHKKWALSVSTGDGRNNYNLKDYYRLKVPTPSIEEQQCISEFVGNLDTLITLHQRELDNLKILKKTLLSKMFV